MTSAHHDLGDRLISPNTTGMDPALWVPLLRLLAAGEPVELGDLAQAAGRTLEQTRQALGATPETEYDEQGRIIGQGLTLRPTRHRFTLDGDELCLVTGLLEALDPGKDESHGSTEEVPR